MGIKGEWWGGELRWRVGGNWDVWGGGGWMLEGPQERGEEKLGCGDTRKGGGEIRMGDGGGIGDIGVGALGWDWGHWGPKCGWDWGHWDGGTGVGVGAMGWGHWGGGNEAGLRTLGWDWGHWGGGFGVEAL